MTEFPICRQWYQRAIALPIGTNYHSNNVSLAPEPVWLAPARITRFIKPQIQPKQIDT